MTVSAVPRVLDPLGGQESTRLQVRASAEVARRRERIAPEVTTMDGGEAVAIVRAGGFIAAIEPVPSELPEGTVIEQDPPAGVLLEREAVVTLRLAIPPIDAPQPASEAEPASEHVPRTTEPDDTEEWFAALALPGGDSQRREPSSRRRRKHRTSTPSTPERIFDPAPAPFLPLGGRTRLEYARGRFIVWRLPAPRILALSLALAGMPWRRVGAVLAGALLFALIGMRFLAPGERRARFTQHRAPRRVAYVQGTALHTATVSPPKRRVLPSRRALGASHPRPRPVRPRARVSTTKEAPAGAIPVRRANQSGAADEPAVSPARPTGGQFAYLGQ